MLVAAAYEHDEVACEPDPVDVEHAVPLAVRDGHLTDFTTDFPQADFKVPERGYLPVNTSLQRTHFLSERLYR